MSCSAALGGLLVIAVIGKRAIDIVIFSFEIRNIIIVVIYIHYTHACLLLYIYKRV